MVKEVPFVTFASTLYFNPGPSRKLAVAHATWVLGSDFWGEAGGGEEIFGASTPEGAEEFLSGSTGFSTGFLGGSETCLVTGAG